MPRKGQRRSWGFLPGAEGHLLPSLVTAYVEALKVRGVSEPTAEKYGWILKRFVAWCHERGLVHPVEVSRPVLERYQRGLYYYRSPKGAPLTVRSQYQHLASVKYFFRWLVRQGQLSSSPAAELEMPRLPRTLPRNVLTEAEAEKILAVPDPSTVTGLRDRAVLEVLYATGIRRTELVRLGLFDVAFERRTLLVREGKGRKDRVVPIGRRALVWLEAYLTRSRPALVVPPDDGTLFLTYMGRPFNADVLGDVVRRMVIASGVDKPGACHLFRHTMATLMLEGGADIRYVQEMLGHAKLETTRVYTQVSVDRLRLVYEATHPAARMPERLEAKGETTTTLADPGTLPPEEVLDERDLDGAEPAREP